MNKQELIKKIAGEGKTAEAIAAIAVNAIEREGWLRNPGVLIDPRDIREGDRVRLEWDDGEARETIATGPRNGVADRYFLLDRPEPELPTEPGATIRVKDGDYYTLSRDGHWYNGDCPHDSGCFHPGGLLTEWEVVA